jgi:DNA-binding GntR family transcriptional regulator
MSNADRNNTPAPKLERKILSDLAASKQPQDAYQLARHFAAEPMMIGQALHRLEEDGRIYSADPKGTANDLARLFTTQ